MKAPQYNERELLAVRSADRVVARVRINKEWKETEFFPAEGQTIRAKLEEVQASLRHSPSFAGIALYVGAMINGERHIASVSHDPLLNPTQLGAAR
jgi:hypothetical protein